MLMQASGNAITAKARAIYGNRIKPADYHELLRMQTVSDIAAYLKTTASYSEYLKSINEMAIHRGQLEDLLTRSLYSKFFSLRHFDFSHDRGFYHYVITNVEVLIILRAIMFLNTDSPHDIFANMPSFIDKYACFDFTQLSKIKSFTDLLNVLNGTPYKDVLTMYTAENGKIDSASCELALKTYYYRSMFKSIEKNYSGKAQKELKEIVLVEIELTNLNLVYRLRRHFKMSPAEIKCRLLPFKYKFTDKRLDALLSDQKREEFIKHMQLSSYNYKMKDIDFNYIEDYTKHLLFFLSHRAIHFSSNPSVAFFALMTLTHIEIDNLTTIIEGVRYKIPSTEIKNLLITE